MHIYFIKLVETHKFCTCQSTLTQSIPFIIHTSRSDSLWRIGKQLDSVVIRERVLVNTFVHRPVGNLSPELEHVPIGSSVLVPVQLKMWRKGHPGPDAEIAAASDKAIEAWARGQVIDDDSERKVIGFSTSGCYCAQSGRGSAVGLCDAEALHALFAGVSRVTKSRNEGLVEVRVKGSNQWSMAMLKLS